MQSRTRPRGGSWGCCWSDRGWGGTRRLRRWRVRFADPVLRAAAEAAQAATEGEYLPLRRSRRRRVAARRGVRRVPGPGRVLAEIAEFLQSLRVPTACRGSDRPRRCRRRLRRYLALKEAFRRGQRQQGGRADDRRGAPALRGDVPWNDRARRLPNASHKLGRRTSWTWCRRLPHASRRRRTRPCWRPTRTCPRVRGFARLTTVVEVVVLNRPLPHPPPLPELATRRDRRCGGSKESNPSP